MRSARTARLGQPDSARTPILLAIGALLVAGLLFGCAEGTAEDARRGEERDRSRTSVVANLQATRAAQRFRTPEAVTVPPTVDVEITTLAIAVELRANNSPVRALAEAPADAETIYASVMIRNLRSGQVVSGVWYDGDGMQIAKTDLTVSSDADEGWVALPLNLAGSREPGEYTVTILVDGRTLESLTFRIVE
jgi:hypothetical protein